jgi:UDP-N-acetylglucosamine:LPS N-acetylglucosamine transferase
MTTAELSAVQTPFLYVPLEGHSEQEQHIHQKMKREGAGKPLNFRETGPADLAEIIVRNLEEGGTPETMQDRGAPHLKRFNGAEKAAEAILREI